MNSSQIIEMGTAYSCFVCNRVVELSSEVELHPLLNLHTCLPGSMQSVKKKVISLLSCDDLTFASEVICSCCFNLLSKIDQLEQKLLIAKDDFITKFNDTLYSHGFQPLLVTVDVNNVQSTEMNKKNITTYTMTKKSEDQVNNYFFDHAKSDNGCLDDCDDDIIEETDLNASEQEISLNEDIDAKRKRGRPPKRKKIKQLNQNKISIVDMKSEDSLGIIDDSINKLNNEFNCKDEFADIDLQEEEGDSPFLREFLQNRKACPSCKRVFSRPRDTLRHMYGTLCRKCGEKSPATLKCFESRHFDASSFVCKICGQNFELKCQLDQHIEANYLNSDGRYKCPKCEKSFNIYVLLAYHFGIHGDAAYRHYRCTQCEAAFTSPTDLRHHMQKHEGGFKCKVCPEQFPSLGKCKRHYKNEHCPEENNCEMCGKSFSSAWSLKLHLRGVHAQEKLYKCKSCSKEFGHQGNFREHMATHSGRKRLVCDICGYMTNFSGNMSKHRKRRHLKPQHQPHLEGQISSSISSTASSLASTSGQAEFLALTSLPASNASQVNVFVDSSDGNNIKLLEAVDIAGERPVYICLENLQQLPLSLENSFVTTEGLRSTFTLMASENQKDGQVTQQDLATLSLVKTDDLDKDLNLSTFKLELGDFVDPHAVKLEEQICLSQID